MAETVRLEDWEYHPPNGFDPQGGLWVNQVTGETSSFPPTEFGIPGISGSGDGDSLMGSAARQFAQVVFGPDAVPDSTLDQANYNFTERKFPLNIGNSSYSGHYMVININVQDATRWDNAQIIAATNQTRQNAARGLDGLSGNQFATFDKFRRQLAFTRNSEFSKTDVLRYNIDNYYRLDGQNPTQAGIIGSRPRFTRRITESIALYMPNAELMYSDRHDYKDISFTSLATGALSAVGGAALGAAAGSMVGGLAGTAIGGVAGFIAESVLKVFDKGLDVAESLAAVGGIPMNPRVEVIFGNTLQRQFSFEFLFAPESEDESEALENIIRTLRFHAAPEVGVGSASAFVFIPPSEFDITFYHRGTENTHIPRINTCVLERVDVSYAPSGMYATFSNGHPVAIRLLLLFRETEIAHKTRIAQGF